ncbi:MAG: UvrD-helicase domain-containing protein [Bacteroidota bacterium]
MKFVADLHIHSHYSRATSKLLRPEHLDYYAGLKGIKIVGTGDFTHPGWLAELKEKTEPDGNGLFKLKNEYKLDSPFGNNETQFLLTAEISNIYKRGGKVRKVHNVVLVPGFEEAEKINTRLINLGGNLTSDGRPILGLDSRDLLEIVLECDDDNYFIPAHIWTPWFSMLGSKSGFDSLEECFDDLSPHIHTIETGLSTDPPMNWLCSFLDNVTLVSNSDAHSPDKLGRNANVFNTDISYYSITEALKTGNPEKYLGTIDMFPQEGKYHYDGHRKCNVCWNPAETLKNNYICPACKKPVTVGVMNRVIHLSDREDIQERPNRLPFRSIIPLKEIIAELNDVGVGSKKVEAEYNSVIKKLGTELDILIEIPLEDIAKKTEETLAEAIRRMRNRETYIQEGYDGEYGVIKVFKPGEAKNYRPANALFRVEKIPPPKKRALINFDLKGIQKLLTQKEEIENLAAEKQEQYGETAPAKAMFNNLNREQFEAVQYNNGTSLIIAGPGTGKTKTLTSKIAWLIANHMAKPEEILAITFTNKAAGELKERLGQLLKNKKKVETITVSTFHAFGLSVLKNHFAEFNRTENFLLADEILKTEILKNIVENKKAVKKQSAIISEIKSGNGETNPLFEKYEKELQKLNAFDLDDLIAKPLQLFSSNSDILQEYQNTFKFIFVDEYQDTNNNQYELLKLLAPDDKSNLCAVGDENQSIYGFRGANSENINRFNSDYPAAKVFNLTKSYRCSQNILSASANVIAQQSGFLEGLNEGIKLSLSDQHTEAAEAEFIARQIVALVGGVSFFSIDSSVTGGDKSENINSLSDFGILCRTRNQFEALSKALRNHHIPYQEVGTSPFYSEEPFQSIIFILEAVLLGDFNSALTLINLKNLKISKLQYEMSLNELKNSKPQSGLEYIRNNFLKATDYNESEWQRFIAMAKEFNTITEFLQYLKLGIGADTFDNKLEAVSLMTIHASKGLEFECVFIPGCEDGLLPYNLYGQETDVEEEKRLLYVGMTRAKKLLYLTSAKSRVIRGRKFNLGKSPFMNAIKEELTEKIKNNLPQKGKKEDNQLSLFG